MLKNIPNLPESLFVKLMSDVTDAYRALHMRPVAGETALVLLDMVNDQNFDEFNFIFFLQNEIEALNSPHYPIYENVKDKGKDHIAKQIALAVETLKEVLALVDGSTSEEVEIDMEGVTFESIRAGIVFTEGFTPLLPSKTRYIHDDLHTNTLYGVQVLSGFNAHPYRVNKVGTGFRGVKVGDVDTLDEAADLIATRIFNALEDQAEDEARLMADMKRSKP